MGRALEQRLQPYHDAQRDFSAALDRLLDAVEDLDDGYSALRLTEPFLQGQITEAFASRVRKYPPRIDWMRQEGPA